MHTFSLLINYVVTSCFESRFQSLDSKKDEKFIDQMNEYYFVTMNSTQPLSSALEIWARKTFGRT